MLHPMKQKSDGMAAEKNDDAHAAAVLTDSRCTCTIDAHAQ